MIITHKLHPMDLTVRGVPQRVDVMQDDKYSRNLQISLYQNGTIWQIPSDVVAVVRYKKSDGKGGNYNTLPDGTTAYEIAGNVLTVALAPQVCTTPGMVKLAVGLIRGNAEINTFVVDIAVQCNPGINVQSEDYFKHSGFVPNSGWEPNLFLGTDADGAVVALPAVSEAGVGEVDPDSDGTGERFNKGGNAATGRFSHAEGSEAVALGIASHAEGSKTYAAEMATHAEGYETEAIGMYSHSEGFTTRAYGHSSHAEGAETEATGHYSHAEGQGTTADETCSHTEGEGTIAAGYAQHVQGKYNIIDDASKYAHIVGNGTSDDGRSNAHTLDWDGNAWYSGKLSVGAPGTEENDVATVGQINLLKRDLTDLQTALIGVSELIGGDA